jgi:hypothetical protein
MTTISLIRRSAPLPRALLLAGAPVAAVLAGMAAQWLDFRELRWPLLALVGLGVLATAWALTPGREGAGGRSKRRPYTTAHKVHAGAVAGGRSKQRPYAPHEVHAGAVAGGTQRPYAAPTLDADGDRVAGARGEQRPYTAGGAFLLTVMLGVATWAAAETVYVLLHVALGERFEAERFGPQPAQALGLIAAHALFLGLPTGAVAGAVRHVIARGG